MGILDPEDGGAVQNTAYCLFLGVLLRDTCSRVDGLGGMDSHVGSYETETRHQRRLLHEDGSMGEEGRGRVFGMGYNMEHRLEDGEDVENAPPLTEIQAWYTRLCRGGAPVGSDVGSGGSRCDGLETRSGSLAWCAIDDPWSQGKTCLV